MKNLFLIPIFILSFIAFIGVSIGSHPFEIDNLGVQVGLSIFIFGFSGSMLYFILTGK